jgi:hypothetical protein
VSARPQGLTILDWLTDPNLLGRSFKGSTWDAWRALLACAFGLPLGAEQLALFRRCAARTAPPTRQFTEVWIAAGRRAGKTRIAAALAVFIAAACDFSKILAPGEVAVVMLLAADRRQARVVMRYVRALLMGAPMLRALVVAERAEALTLSTGACIEIHTSSYKSTRGYTLAAVIADEAAFWSDPEGGGTNPAAEVFAALRPALATVPGAKLWVISSPHARRGPFYEVFRKHHGVDASPILTWQAPTRTMNPGIPEEVVAAAYAADAATARAEWGGEFRDDIEQLLTPELVASVTPLGRESLPYDARFAYVAFVDCASGSGTDSMTCCIAHLVDLYPGVRPVPNPRVEWGVEAPSVEREAPGVIVIDQLVERRPPFSAADAVDEFARLLRHYGVYEVVGDRFAGGIPTEMFASLGITYRFASEPTSALYGRLLVAITSRSVELLDHPRLQRQLCSLERRTTRASGRPLISAPPRAHDDLCTAVAGAVGVLQAEAYDDGGDYALETAYGV